MGMGPEVLAREKGGGQRVLGSLQSPHTHCTLSIAKFPFRLPEQTSHLPNKTKRAFLIMEKEKPKTLLYHFLCPPSPT